MITSYGSGARTLVIRAWLVQTDTTASRAPRGYQHHFISFTSVLSVTSTTPPHTDIQNYKKKLDEIRLHQLKIVYRLASSKEKRGIINALSAAREHVVHPIKTKHLTVMKPTNKAALWSLDLEEHLCMQGENQTPQTFSISHRTAPLFQLSSTSRTCLLLELEVTFQSQVAKYSLVKNARENTLMKDCNCIDSRLKGISMETDVTQTDVRHISTLSRPAATLRAVAHTGV